MLPPPEKGDQPLSVNDYSSVPTHPPPPRLKFLAATSPSLPQLLLPGLSLNLEHETSNHAGMCFLVPCPPWAAALRGDLGEDEGDLRTRPWHH